MQNEILWTSGFFNERFPAPVSPLGWSHLGPIIEETALRDPLRFLGYPDANTIQLSRAWRGHPYTNVVAFQIFYRIFPDFFLPHDAYRFFPDGDVTWRKRAPYPRSIFSPRFWLSLFRAFLRDPGNFSPLHNYRVWGKYTRVHDKRVAELCARFAVLRDADPGLIFDALRDVEKIHRDFLHIHRWSLMHADITFGLFKRLGGGEIVVEQNKTLEVDADLRRLPREEFLLKHGHRSFSLDMAVPTFAEEPSQVERLLRTTEDRRPKTEPSPPSFVLRPSSFVASLARRYLTLREDQRYYWQKSLAVARQLYLILADRLLAQDIIGERDAIFYATHHELAEYFDGRVTRDELRRIIGTRCEEWRVYQREFAESPTNSYPAFLRGDVPLAHTRHNAQAEWHGSAISSGVVRGVVRVVHSPDELARVQPGDILVAPATDPAWTPVFAIIAGLVVERGGVLSHSAVVAREYRVPGVAGIPGIVDAVQDGDMIEVDGTNGVVSRVKY